MDLSQQLITYCERTDFSFWSEPVNALTNSAFVIAAIFMWRAQRSQLPQSIAALPFLLALIGLSSFAFHTMATVGTMLADVLSILIFACFFLFALLRHYLRFSVLKSLPIVLLFAVISFFFPRILPTEIRQVAGYFPYLFTLLGFSIYFYRIKNPVHKELFVGTALLASAIFFRSIDLIVCNLFPLGTHFLWHLINAFNLYYLGRSLATHCDLLTESRKNDS